MGEGESLGQVPAPRAAPSPHLDMHKALGRPLLRETLSEASPTPVSDPLPWERPAWHTRRKAMRMQVPECRCPLAECNPPGQARLAPPTRAQLLKPLPAPRGLESILQGKGRPLRKGGDWAEENFK